MQINDKIKYFDYLITSLINKCYLSGQSPIDFSAIRLFCEKNNLSKLKLMKLLFFITTVNARDDWFLLEKVFNRYYAMPYGPVESDIYGNLNLMTNYALIKNRIVVRESAKFEYGLDKAITEVIDDSIDALIKINQNLFLMGAFELVELSHKAESWRITFNEAQSTGSLSKQMPIEVIKVSRVYFK